MGIEVVAKNYLQPSKTMFLSQFWKLRSKISKSFKRFDISHVIRMSFACYLFALIFFLYVLIFHSYVSRMYSYASVRHSYVLVWHPYVTRMYSYLIRMSLVCGFTMNLHWRLSTILKTSKKVYQVMFFWYVKVCIIGKCI